MNNELLWLRNNAISKNNPNSFVTNPTEEDWAVWDAAMDYAKKADTMSKERRMQWELEKLDEKRQIMLGLGLSTDEPAKASPLHTLKNTAIGAGIGGIAGASLGGLASAFTGEPMWSMGIAGGLGSIAGGIGGALHGDKLFYRE